MRVISERTEDGTRDMLVAGLQFARPLADRVGARRCARAPRLACLGSRSRGLTAVQSLLYVVWMEARTLTSLDRGRRE
jgi:hypothetical protein